MFGQLIVWVQSYISFSQGLQFSASALTKTGDPFCIMTISYNLIAAIILHEKDKFSIISARVS